MPWFLGDDKKLFPLLCLFLLYVEDWTQGFAYTLSFEFSKGLRRRPLESFLEKIKCEYWYDKIDVGMKKWRGWLLTRMKVRRSMVRRRPWKRALLRRVVQDEARAASRESTLPRLVFQLKGQIFIEKAVGNHWRDYTWDVSKIG